ncbi:hypothetical protein ACPEIF_17835 [Streptomyces sp. NPDC012600]|uniref:Secreted protein n=2 Tax=Streptomycetaceae TaxID=2062 RepID=A0ABU2W9H4_9ACTN|nr:hypothetical protein [Streptomyces griseus]ARF71534.1 hypothetical protein B7C62_04110 [Kitasatospora albolonga]MDT0494528.1 hypothetical protein [Streptomyces griseus]
MITPYVMFCERSEMSKAVDRRFVKTVGVFAGALGLALMSTAAYAGTNAYALTTDSSPGGRAGFDHDGPGAEEEFLSVCDQKADGYRATVEASWSGGSIRLDAASGKGTCKHTTSSFNIPEGRTVTFKVCLRDGYSGTPKFCATSKGVA